MSVAICDPDLVAILIYQYTGATTSKPFVIVSDASPTGICAALYHTRQQVYWLHGVNSSFHMEEMYGRNTKAAGNTLAT